LFNRKIRGIQDNGIVCRLEWSDGSLSITFVALTNLFEETR
jgi:hypothetical protein